MTEATKSGAAAVLDTGAIAEKLAAAVGRAEVGSALLSMLASAQKAVSSLELASAELQKSAGRLVRTWYPHLIAGAYSEGPQNGSPLKLPKALETPSIGARLLLRVARMNPRAVVGILKELPPQLQPVLDCQAYVQSTEEARRQRFFFFLGGGGERLRFQDSV